jgi:hypothetical protein
MPLYAPYARRLRQPWRIDQCGEGVVVSIATVDRSYFELNGGVLYRFPIDSDDVSPFALGGLDIARTKVEGDEVSPGARVSHTDLGLNLGGGVTFLTGPVRPSVGREIELSGGQGFVIFGALGFPLG